MAKSLVDCCGQRMPVVRTDYLVSGYISRTRICPICNKRIITQEFPCSIQTNGMSLRRSLALAVLLFEKYMEDEPLPDKDYLECRQAKRELEKFKEALSNSK